MISNLLEKEIYMTERDSKQKPAMVAKVSNSPITKISIYKRKDPKRFGVVYEAGGKKIRRSATVIKEIKIPRSTETFRVHTTLGEHKFTSNASIKFGEGSVQVSIPGASDPPPSAEVAGVDDSVILIIGAIIVIGVLAGLANSLISSVDEALVKPITEATDGASGAVEGGDDDQEGGDGSSDSEEGDGGEGDGGGEGEGGGQG